MARLQVPKTIALSGLTTTPQAISGSQLNVTSFIVQCPSSNADFIVLGDVSGQSLQIAPGHELAINGDNLDNGTTGYLNLNQWFLKSMSGVLNANIMYLERY